MTIYRKRLGSASLTVVSTVTMGTVPAGKMWVVRECSYRAGPGFAGSVLLVPVGAAAETISTGDNSGAASAKTFLDNRNGTVLNAGDALQASVTTAGTGGHWFCLVSGYEFSV